VWAALRPVQATAGEDSSTGARGGHVDVEVVQQSFADRGEVVVALVELEQASASRRRSLSSAPRRPARRS
jgi:hypothetical protein